MKSAQIVRKSKFIHISIPSIRCHSIHFRLLFLAATHASNGNLCSFRLQLEFVPRLQTVFFSLLLYFHTAHIHICSGTYTQVHALQSTLFFCIKLYFMYATCILFVTNLRILYIKFYFTFRCLPYYFPNLHMHFFSDANTHICTRTHMARMREENESKTPFSLLPFRLFLFSRFFSILALFGTFSPKLLAIHLAYEH